MNITVATVESQTEFDAYICQVFGNLLPLSISWLAQDSANANENTQLSNTTEGLVIVDSVIGDAIESELRLFKNGSFTSPTCRIMNGNGLIVDQQDFIGVKIFSFGGEGQGCT